MSSRTVTVASCHWRDLIRTMAVRPMTKESGGFANTFLLPAPADRMKPSLLIVEPMNENLGMVNGIPMVKVVQAEDLARDLVASWGSGGEYVAYGCPAVFVCGGAAPTADEIRTALRKQELWCGAGVNQAQNHWVKGERDKVNDLHREMARYLGKTDFEWFKQQAAVELLACPYCQQQIPSTASICSHCGRVANPALLAKTEKLLAVIEADTKKLQAAVKQINPDADFRDPEAILAQGEFAMPEALAAPGPARPRK